MGKSGIKKARKNIGHKEKILTKPAIELSERTKKALFLSVAFLIPLLFFVLLEAGLRLFNYGRSFPEWVQLTENKLTLNPEIGYKYFYSTKNIPFATEAVIDKEKKPGAFRVFVLGESAAAGYPYNGSASFSKYLRKALEKSYPGRTIEVANISMAAISSYCLLDLLPGIIEQKPDLILIYTGHNEYYGALGAASTESLGHSRTVVRSMLFLNKLRTVQLLRNSVKGIMSALGTGKNSGTLMARVAKGEFVDYNSSTYRAGLEQFRANLSDILQTCKEAGVPVIISTLASNLKDIEPFVSRKSEGNPPALELYRNAQRLFQKKNYQEAKKEFTRAKDLDCLRFRASEDINNEIISLGQRFNCQVIKADSMFNALSYGGVCGNELMTDHLHPNLRGYQYLGELFLDRMNKAGLLPDGKRNGINLPFLDSYVRNHFYFSAYDSTLAAFRIKILKNDWPYVKEGSAVPRNNLLNPGCFVDSVAVRVMDGSLSRLDGRKALSDYYLMRKDLLSYSIEMHALLDEFPFMTEAWDAAAIELNNRGAFGFSLDFIQGGYQARPDAYNTKYMGMFAVHVGDYDQAIKYLTESLGYRGNDPQTMYNLAFAYYKKHDFSNGMLRLNQCTSLDSKFPGAPELKRLIGQER